MQSPYTVLEPYGEAKSYLIFLNNFNFTTTKKKRKKEKRKKDEIRVVDDRYL